MAAAQVAKKLKDKRKQRTIEGIFKKVNSRRVDIFYVVNFIFVYVEAVNAKLHTLKPQEKEYTLNLHLTRPE